MCWQHVGASAPLVGAEAPAVAEAEVELLRQTWGSCAVFAEVRSID
eukprot:SAG11_NODE_571_length_8451_cov_34.938218_1_plen_46_part_00